MPAGRDAVARAATMIGQDRIVASPLAMAGVAATVADGRWHAPRLVASDRRRTGPALDEGELSTLRTLMRSVVTSGTGTALAAVPGEVAGKSGTAEYGGGDPPPTHAWFIAFRGDLAVAVLVENGRSGGSVAAPIAARFFDALGAGTTATSPSAGASAVAGLRAELASPREGGPPAPAGSLARSRVARGVAAAERRSCPPSRGGDEPTSASRPVLALSTDMDRRPRSRRA